MRIDRVVIHEFELPLDVPFTTSVRTIDSLPRILVELETEEGLVGFGESAPNYEVTGESGTGVAEILAEVMAPIVLGRSPMHVEQIRQALAVVHGTPAAHAGIDIALADLRAKRSELPLYQLLGGAEDEPSVSVPKVVSMETPEEMVDRAVRGADAGHKQIKIKVGNDPQMDIRRIRSVAEAIPDDISLKADVNQGWGDAKTSLQVLSKVSEYLDLVEQPVNEDSLDDLRMVRERTDIPVMADEPVRSSRDAMNVIKQGAADLLNIKLMKSGGIVPAVQLNAVAEADGRQTQLGSMIEGEVGTAAGVHFVAALDNVAWNELVGPSMTTGDFTDLTVEGPTLETSGPGLGIEIDRRRLESLRTNHRVIENTG